MPSPDLTPRHPPETFVVRADARALAHAARAAGCLLWGFPAAPTRQQVRSHRRCLAWGMRSAPMGRTRRERRRAARAFEYRLGRVPKGRA